MHSASVIGLGSVFIMTLLLGLNAGRGRILLQSANAANEGIEFIVTEKIDNKEFRNMRSI